MPGDDKNHCYICGRYGDHLDLHHVFGASDRDMSTKYGLTCHLCREHHTGSNGVHGKDGKSIKEFLQISGEEYFIDQQKNFGLTREEAIEKFRKEFRKSYV